MRLARATRNDFIDFHKKMLAFLDLQNFIFCSVVSRSKRDSDSSLNILAFSKEQ